MEGNYEVSFGRQVVGNVLVERLGLYYRFHCRCKLTGDVICRLQVVCGDKQENLGILVPVGEGFGIDTKLPIKKLGEGIMRFFLLPKHEAATEVKFVPIYPEEPFRYISRLKTLYLERQNGQIGILSE